MLKRYIKEIKAVGFFDWFWFVFVLKRNSFSPKLRMMNYYPNMQRLYIHRVKARQIEETLNRLIHNKECDHEQDNSVY